MTNSANKLFWIALLVFNLNIEARATNPVVCLQFETQPLGGTPPQSLYDGDRYEDGPTMCLDGPVFVGFTFNSGVPVPQICETGCETARKDDVSKAPCGRLNTAFAIDHNFKDHVPKSSMTPSGQAWNPQACTTVLLTRWVRLQTPGRTIPVKLYVVRTDISKPKVGLTGEALPKKNLVRTQQIGFEMAGYPADVDFEALPVLHPKPWELNPKCLTACTVQPDLEGEPFFVLTNRAVFSAPRAKVVEK